MIKVISFLKQFNDFLFQVLITFVFVSLFTLGVCSFSFILLDLFSFS